ncbi:MAG: lipopolysaccharide kinase InaA family protein, partial [Burkholderiales bacterium]
MGAIAALADAQGWQPPFSLRLSSEKDSDTVLRCLSLVRRIPNKRMVCLAQWNNRPVFAKLFIDAHRARVHWQREERGVRTLWDNGILTPEVLYSGTSADGNTRVLIFERIAPAQSVRDAWGQATPTARRGLLRAMVEVLAAHHRAGLRHCDLHLNNFLLSNDRIYTLDGAEVTAGTGPLGEGDSLDNLGALFAQLTPDNDPLARELFPDYVRARGWDFSAAMPEQLQHPIDRHRARRKRRLLEKVFRECSAVVSEKSATRFMACDRVYDSAALRVLLDDPDRALGNARMLKRGNTCTLGEVEVDGRRLVIKRYNIK